MSTINQAKKEKLCFKRNDRVISLSSANSKGKTVSIRHNNTEQLPLPHGQYNLNTLSNLNNVEAKSTLFPSNTNNLPLGINNRLNNIKRSIFVHKQATIIDSDAKYSSNVLLTSPYVSQGLKNKYSQIYLETMNSINANEQKNLLMNNALTNLSGPNATITKKKEELMVLLNGENASGNKQNYKTANASPVVKKVISLQANYINGYNQMKYANIFTPSPSKQKTMKFIKTKSINLTESNDEVSKCINKIRNKGQGHSHSNSYRIQEAQSKFERMMENPHKPIIFSNRIVKKPPLPKKNPATKEDISTFMNGLQVNVNNKKQ